ncbi:hypothetical protein EC968_004454 [Mortierella alpina]|nr:hypothetical protein EC968_004454 [Mortierella alpina]
MAQTSLASLHPSAPTHPPSPPLPRPATAVAAQSPSLPACDEQDTTFRRLTGQVVHARKCYKRLFFIDLRINEQEKVTVLFRSDDQREHLPQSLTDLELISRWKRIKRGDRITLQVFAASEEESAKRDHPVFQATDFSVLESWPGDNPFPTEPALGLKEPMDQPSSSASKSSSAPSTRASLKISGHEERPEPDSWREYCKFWINSQKCLKKDCRMRHPTGQEYTEIQQMWVKERTQARKERSKLQDDPHSISSKVPHSQRAYIFCRWLVDRYGKEYLNSGSGVLDVAGGKGEISLFLTHMFGIRSTVVEPNVRRDKPYQRRNLMDVIQKQLDIEAGGDGNFYRKFASVSHKLEDQELNSSCGAPETAIDLGQTDNGIMDLKERRRVKKQKMAQFVVPRLCSLLDDQFVVKHPGVLEQASIIIGMHPDQATEPIVTMALQHHKPFAVVPCCVFAHENPQRRLLGGGEVNTTLDFIQYLMEKRLPCVESLASNHLTDIHKEFLPFDGMNIVVFRNHVSKPCEV